MRLIVFASSIKISCIEEVRREDYEKKFVADSDNENHIFGLGTFSETDTGCFCIAEGPSFPRTPAAAQRVSVQRTHGVAERDVTE